MVLRLDMLLSSRWNEVQSFSILPCDLSQSCGFNLSPNTNDSHLHLSLYWDKPPPVLVTYTNYLPFPWSWGLSRQFCLTWYLSWCWKGRKLCSDLTQVDGSWHGWGWDRLGFSAWVLGSPSCGLSMWLGLLTAWQLDSKNSYIYSWLHYLKMFFKKLGTVQGSKFKRFKNVFSEKYSFQYCSPAPVLLRWFVYSFRD